jgi:hypothetical protein
MGGADVVVGAGAVTVVVLSRLGGGPFPGAKCEWGSLEPDERARASFGWAREPMAAV